MNPSKHLNLAGLLALFTFGSLTASVAAAADVAEQRCLSLRVLSRQVELAAHENRPLPQTILTLAGISSVDGFCIDPQTHDVILVGTYKATPKNWPALHLDDLVVNLRNVWQSDTYPYCSLDPIPANILKVQKLLALRNDISTPKARQRLLADLTEAIGDQRTRLGGIPVSSRVSHTLILADFHMKSVSQGSVILPGITSPLDASIQAFSRNAGRDAEPPASQMSMSRFFFHIQEGQPTFDESDAIVWLRDCNVVVLTERQMAKADGDLVDAGPEDPQAKAFVAQFSEHLEQSALQVPVYRELINLYRLNATLRAMKLRRAFELTGFDADFLLGRYQYTEESPMPSSMPGLANAKAVEFKSEDATAIYTTIFFPMVAGGVSMEIPVTADRFNTNLKLTPLVRAVLASRPDRDRLWWPLGK